jgi:hypothetical protein
MIDRNNLVNHKYTMRIRDITEAPIGNIDTVDLSDSGSFAHRTDRAIIRSEKARAKIRRVLAKVPQTIDLVFLDTGSPIADEELNSYIFGIGGVFDREQLSSRVHFFPEPSTPDAIMLVLTNNEGQQRVQLSPWILMHRMGHGLALDEGGFETYLQNVNYCLRDIVQFARDGWGTPQIAIVFAVATMKSVRERTLTSGLEVIFEWVAQYCVQGRVTLNRLKLEEFQRMCPPHPDYSGARPPTESDLADLNRIIGSAEYGINRILGDMMKALEGKVVIL